MLRAIDKWGAGYLRSVARRPRNVSGARHLIFCIADHFEPYRGGVSDSVAQERLGPWRDEYIKATGDFRDADGFSPRHTFFCPQEEYNGKCLSMLGALCGKGAGEVEIHLHHRDDTADGLRDKLISFRDMLHKQHGMLGLMADRKGIPSFGFVHGNWALCNSRPDGEWCGVNEELSILADAGCYADFTFPSAPSPTQPRMVNCIYRAKDNQGAPRSADKGQVVRVVVGAPPENERELARNQLMLIQGPLGLNWKKRRYVILPRLENAEVSGSNPATFDRVDLWVKQGIHLAGRPEWIFVKVHTHGCVYENMKVLLKPQSEAQSLHVQLQRYNDGSDWNLHYVTAREMYNIVRAAEDGKTGNAGEYRDYEIKPPAVSQI